jgi:hypothetical protein
MTIEHNAKANKIVITIDVSPAIVKAAPWTSSGKNRLVASTGGNLPINGTGLKLGLNLYTK